jgi:hypothetical protein
MPKNEYFDEKYTLKLELESGETLSFDEVKPEDSAAVQESRLQENP